MGRSQKFSRRRFVASAVAVATVGTFPTRAQASGLAPTSRGETMIKLTPYLLYRTDLGSAGGIGEPRT